MLGNLPKLELFKSKRSKDTDHVNLESLFDLYNDHEQQPWNVVINLFDRRRIDLAHKNNCSVRITDRLSDKQLLKLQAESFPEYNNQLVYHKMFGIYEVKYRKQTIRLFSYRNGLYTPVNDIL